VQHEISIFIGLKRHLRSLQGVLEDGQQIAVKKLSMGSRQGVREFLNEVRLLLKVQHRNLVSLLGCCASSGHNMLVYPYFPNGSLDHILFGESPPVPLATGCYPGKLLLLDSEILKAMPLVVV
jgi:serine/threonine protein kinase